jgi:2-(1,2-epoxy-1,2-dihydrophenyl)acetyl-CoA isomerase
VTAFEHVRIETRDGVGTLTLNRPDKLNAFAGRMREEIADAIRQMAGTDDVRVIVITGAGRAFCAGADIDYMQSVVRDQDWEAARGLVEAGRQVVTTIRNTSKPVPNVQPHRAAPRLGRHVLPAALRGRVQGPRIDLLGRDGGC